MERTRSSARPTPTRDSEDGAPTTPQSLPQVMDIEHEVSDKSTDDEPMDDDLMDGNSSDHELEKQSPDIESITRRAVLETAADSTSPSSRKAKKRSEYRETEKNTDILHHTSEEREIDQEHIRMHEGSQDKHQSPAQSHSRQRYTKEFTEFPTRADDDESPSSRQSSINPETPRRSPEATKSDKSPTYKRNISETIASMSAAIRREYKEKEKIGQAYLLGDPDEEITRFKIGCTSMVERRVREHKKRCSLESSWHPKLFPRFPARGYKNLERIAHEETHYMKHIFKCSCGTTHKEYFFGEKEIARQTLEFWAQWLERYEPYDSDGKLLSFWAERLDMFRNNSKHYFKCLDPSCKRHFDSEICHGCLRAGWKAWTEPERMEPEEPEQKEPEREEPEQGESEKKAPEKFSLMSLSLFNIICILAVLSFVTECTPLFGKIVDPNSIRKLESLLIVCLWVYKELVSPKLEAPIAKKYQQVPEGYAKTPKKQWTKMGTPRTAPAKLVDTIRHAERPGNTPVRMPPQEQIPDTEPIQNTYDRGARDPATDDSPTKAAQARKQSNRLSRRSIEKALERTFTLPTMQG